MQRDLSVGIHLSETGAEAAFIQRRRQRVRRLAYAKAPGDQPFLDPVDPLALARTFKTLSKGLPKAARRADVPVLVSLPAPFVREDTLTFASFPDKIEEARNLVQMRMARETWAEADTISCTFQRLDKTDEGIRVLVRTMPLALRDEVEAAATAAGFHVTLLEGWSGLVLNQLSRAKLGDSGAFLWSDGRIWTLVCWSDATPEGFLESGWIEPVGKDVALKKIVRLVRSFQRSDELESIEFRVEAPELFFAALTALTALTAQQAAGDPKPVPAKLDGPPDFPAQRVAVWP